MTTDRKDGQSENYGFTLVINTPPPVYDSGLKPLEVVGELTFKIITTYLRCLCVIKLPRPCNTAVRQAIGIS